MQNTVEVSGKIHWIGTNDRRTHLFENMWPLEHGVSYNSYIINDEKVALVDTVEIGTAAEYLDKIESIIGDKPIDYLIVNHMEPDHSGAIGAILHRHPDMKIIGNIKTKKILQAYFPVADENYMLVADGDELDLGYHKLKFVMTPWVHWPETMVSYDMTDKVMFSCDAFGTFGSLDGGIFDDEINFSFYEEEMRRYYSNIVGKYSNMVQKAFKKLDGIEVSIICSSHGPIWRSNPQRVLDLYYKWSNYETERGVVIIWGSMYGNTEKMADVIARHLVTKGIRNIKMYDASKTHISHLIKDIWKYKGVILGSCAYNSGMYPKVAQLCSELEHMQVKNHFLGLFGSYSWNGGGVKNLMKFADNIEWDLIADPAEIKGSPSEANLDQLEVIATEMAKKLKEEFPMDH
ncbi:MAG: FprA family A-type flavoprotein [Bacteroidales bacterium]|jgi:flavorubredoxin|nr:FprA family A-type flavoprotein [Bacteroidales bacterium]